jgi:hypothetical protein
VGDRLSVRFHHRRQSQQDRLDDRRTQLCSLLNVVERSITAERLVVELKKVFAAAGDPPKVLRMDNGPEFISQALQQFCDRRVGMSHWNTLIAGLPHASRVRRGLRL